MASVAIAVVVCRPLILLLPLLRSSISAVVALEGMIAAACAAPALTGVNARCCVHCCCGSCFVFGCVCFVLLVHVCVLIVAGVVAISWKQRKRNVHVASSPHGQVPEQNESTFHKGQSMQQNPMWELYSLELKFLRVLNPCRKC